MINIIILVIIIKIINIKGIYRDNYISKRIGLKNSPYSRLESDEIKNYNNYINDINEVSKLPKI